MNINNKDIEYLTNINCKLNDNYSYTSSEYTNLDNAERIIAELEKLLKTKRPSIGIHLMEKGGLLQKVLPEVLALNDVKEENCRRHKNNYFHTLQVLDQTREKTDDLVVLWTALLHDIGKIKTRKYEEGTGWSFHNHEKVGAYMIRKIGNRLRLSQKQVNDIVKLVENHGRPKELIKDGVSDSAIRRLVVDMGESLSNLMLFCSCDITTKFEDKRKIQVEELINLYERVTDIEERDNLRNFKLPVSGEEIMEEYNLKPSKIVGDIKQMIKDAILDGTCINEKTAALKFMKDNVKL